MQQREALFRAPGATRATKIDSGKSIIRLNMRVVETFDEATAQSLFALFVKNRTWHCPTLTLLRAQIDDPLPANDPRLKYLSREVRAKWDAGRVVAGVNNEQENASESVNSYGGYRTNIVRKPLVPCNTRNLQPLKWCGRGDLNPHAFRRHPLKMVCLPVPPLPHAAENGVEGRIKL